MACLMQRKLFMLDVRMWTSTPRQLTKHRTSECQLVLVVNKGDVQLIIQAVSISVAYHVLTFRHQHLMAMPC